MSDAPLARSRSVLTLIEDDSETSSLYGVLSDDQADWPERVRVLTLDSETVEDFGSPEQITVTIEPGDKLTDTDSPETYGVATFDTIRRSDGKFDWRLTHENGDQLGGSSQGYETRSMAWEIGRRCVGGGYEIVFESSDG